MAPDDEILSTDTLFEDWLAPPLPGFPIVTLA
jgi:hypothetical protein